MCLHSVDPVKTHVGYKVAIKTRDGLYLSFYARHQHYFEWQRAKIPINETLDGYPLGFHILRSKKDAASYGYSRNGAMLSGDKPHIIKVEYRHVLATGLESDYTKDCRCVVALDMRMIEDCGEINEVRRKLKC